MNKVVITKKHYNIYTVKFERGSFKFDQLERHFEIEDIDGKRNGQLTISESNLLMFYLEHYGKVLSDNEVFKETHGIDDDLGDWTRTTSQMRYKVKQKIGKKHWITHQGKGTELFFR